ncbi:RES family NAD+ phosphorylase [Oceanobacillus oncorhynchi]|uniref:RES family NAD+ phosphorylase n=1 Tax=Oceanobacillus oncorhynchi TaxID=545501 RepID=UPI0021165D88|nr:RES family NAD+ phosphorylase [Oceanobacillus oncorhynchi]UUI39981.1 RES family NAD+ phosphorylase [Oceanobacillus oncorhynchi]
MEYIWWWRGGNSPIGKFEVSGNYLLMDYWKLRIEELYIQISPISVFDYIVFRVKGEKNNTPDIRNYNWTNEFVGVDLDHHTFYDYSIREHVDEDLQYFKQPYNFILSAKFALPNLNMKGYSDSEIEIMLNKLLFNVIGYNEFKTWYNGILIGLKRQIDQFYNYLKEYPMLALNTEFGRHILENINGLGKHEITNASFYRARKMKEYIPYDEGGMWHPAAEKVAIYEGRYNHFGQSFLYLSSNEMTAFSEVIPLWHRSCSMIRIDVNQPIYVLDLRKVNFYTEEKGMNFIILHYMLVYEGIVSRETKNEYVKPEYLVPRFIADCSRLYDFDGILFSSVKGEGENLVLFEPDKLKLEQTIVTFEQPYIFNQN